MDKTSHLTHPVGDYLLVTCMSPGWKKYPRLRITAQLDWLLLFLLSHKPKQQFENSSTVLCRKPKASAAMLIRHKPRSSARWVTSELCICSIFLSKYRLTFYLSTHRLLFSLLGSLLISPTLSPPMQQQLLSAFQLFPLLPPAPSL